MNQGYKSVLCISKGNLTLQAITVNCELIAVIYSYGISLKLWVGTANLKFPCRHIIVDWQKQYNNCGFVGVECQSTPLTAL